jgi:hypothetical protein
MDNQIAIVKTTALLRRIVEKERLADDPRRGVAVFNQADVASSATAVVAKINFHLRHTK